VVTANTLRAVNWNFALLFGVLISLATVFARRASIAGSPIVSPSRWAT
jgi:hypothetical protein